MKAPDDLVLRFTEGKNLKASTKVLKFPTPESLWNKALEYFEYMQTRKWVRQEVIKSGDNAGDVIEVEVSTPLTMSSFALFCGVTEVTLLNYSKEERYKDYHLVMAQIKTIIKTNQLEGGMLGAYNATIVSQLNRLANKVELTGDEGGPVEVQQITGMKIV